MVAPCYFLAGPIFEDGGFYGKNGRLRGFGEDAEGPDVEGESAERGYEAVRGMGGWGSCGD